MLPRPRPESTAFGRAGKIPGAGGPHGRHCLQEATPPSGRMAPPRRTPPAGSSRPASRRLRAAPHDIPLLCAMRAVVQRVSSAKVEVDGRVVGSITRGLAALVGIEASDTP